MKVSFTGIKDIYIGNKNSEIRIPAITEDDQIRELPGVSVGLQLKCRLTNDNDGNHFDRYQNAVKKTGVDLFSKSGSDVVDIRLFENVAVVNGEILPVYTNQFLNNKPINLAEPSDRRLLPIHSFLAQMATEILNKKQISENQKEAVQSINANISNTAENFIEEIM